MKLPALATARLWLLMLLPFVLWGTAMTAMAPLLETGGGWVVAACAFAGWDCPPGLGVAQRPAFDGRSPRPRLVRRSRLSMLVCFRACLPMAWRARGQGLDLS